MGKEKVEKRKDNVSTKSQNHQENSGHGQEVRSRFEFSDFSSSKMKNFNMRLSVICDSPTWVLSNTSNFFNMTDWIFTANYHMVLTPQHGKLLFLPITLQHVGVWSTKIHYLDVCAALQAETKCMIKE